MNTKKNMSKNAFTSWIMILLLVLNSALIPNVAWGAETTQQSDINGHWAEAQIADWMGQDLISGYGVGQFKPNNEITRAEFMAIANNAYGFTKLSMVEFPDVPKSAWYHDVVSKAKEAGYITGYDNGTMRPMAPISRQEAAAILAKLMKLSGTENGLNKFSDRNMFPQWSKAAIGAVVTSGYMSGYPDGTYKHLKSITRAESVMILSNAVGMLYKTPGTFGTETVQTINGNVTISSTDVNLKNMNIKGNLYLTAGIYEGNVKLENVTVSGLTLISGGGVNSVTLKNCNLADVTVDRKDGKVRVVVEGSTSVKIVRVMSASKLETQNLTPDNNGFITVYVMTGEEVVLEGAFKEVVVKNLNTNVTLTKGSIESLIIDASAKGSIVNIMLGAIVKELAVNGSATIKGTGEITNAMINVSGVVIDQMPKAYKIADTLMAMIGGKEVAGSSTPIIPGGVFIPPVIPAATLSSIAITTPATKTVYNVFETLDIAGLIVTGTYSDATTAPVPITAGNITGFDSSLPAAAQTLTITYGGKTATYNVSIVAVPVVDLTSFDAIANIDAGMAGIAIDLAAVQALLPMTVSANTAAVNVPVTAWVDTDTYDPAVAGSYTFTATLGAIPAGFTNTGNLTASVEVIVSPFVEVDITSFDAIANVNAGMAGIAIDLAAVQALLPMTVSANSGAVNVPVTAWVDTDTYDPAVAGSYTFTATLGAIPAGFTNTGNLTASVEVVVSEFVVVDITTFDAIANVNAGIAGSATYANAAAVQTMLLTTVPTVSANTAAVNVPVTAWVDTDTYNPAVAGSYTFTATLGAIPIGFTNTGNLTATVEVVVSATAILAAFNNATDAAAIGTAITTYAPTLSVLLTEYNLIVNKTPLHTELLNRGFTTEDQIKTAIIIAIVNNSDSVNIGNVLSTNATYLGLQTTTEFSLIKVAMQDSVFASKPIADKTQLIVLAINNSNLSYIGLMLPSFEIIMGIDLTDYNALASFGKLNAQYALVALTTATKEVIKSTFDASVATSKANEATALELINNASTEVQMGTAIMAVLNSVIADNSVYNGLSNKLPVQTVLLVPTFVSMSDFETALTNAALTQSGSEMAAMTSINDATTSADMNTAIVNGGAVLGWNLTDYIALTNKLYVQNIMISDIFSSFSVMKTTFDSAVGVQKVVDSINTANVSTVGSLLTSNVTSLGLRAVTITDYNALLLTDKDAVHAAMVGKSFADKDAVKAAFEIAVVVPHFNAIALPATMGTAIGNYATTLGLDLMDYNMLDSMNKTVVHNAMLTPTFLTIEQIMTAFDVAVAEAMLTNTVMVVGVNLNKSELYLYVTDTEMLIATIMPANATDQSVTWSVIGSAATVGTDGTVTASSLGDATVSVTTTDGGFVKSIIVHVVNEGIIVGDFNAASEFVNPSLITKYASLVGLDLTNYLALSADNKAIVHLALTSKNFTTTAQIKSAFDTAVGELVLQDINLADLATLSTILNDNATALGLTLGAYNGLSDQEEVAVNGKLLLAPYFGMFYNSTAGLQLAIDTAVTDAADTVTALIAINGATAGTMQSVLEANALLLGLDLTSYLLYADKATINTSLVNMIVTSEFTNAYDLQVAIDVELDNPTNLILTEFNSDTMDILTMATTITNNAVAMGLDLTAYNELTTEQQEIVQGDLMYNPYFFDLYNNIAEINTVFNLAVANAPAMETALNLINAATLLSMNQVLVDSATILRLDLSEYDPNLMNTNLELQIFNNTIDLQNALYVINY